MRVVVPLSAMAFIVGACGDGGIESGGNTTGVTRETGADGGSDSVDPELEAKIQEMFDDADVAVQVVDAFWARHWADVFTGTYTSPEVYGGYIGSEGSPACGGEVEDMSGNAFYCNPDDYVAWDWELLASQFLDESIGDAFVYMVIAHEWGHAIQADLDSSLWWASRELQADCFAGAELAGAIADGDLLFESGDRGEIFESLVSVADEFEWGDSSDHGTADERIEAYQRGEAGGVAACLPDP
jgi:predicted metalloprotease